MTIVKATFNWNHGQINGVIIREKNNIIFHYKKLKNSIID